MEDTLEQWILGFEGVEGQPSVRVEKVTWLSGEHSYGSLAGSVRPVGSAAALADCYFSLGVPTLGTGAVDVLELPES